MTVASQYRRSAELAFKTGPTETTTVTLSLKQVTDAVRVSLIRQQLNLNDSIVILEGRLLEPRRAPAALKAGYEAPLEWRGRVGVARLEPYEDAIPQAWRDRYGEKLTVTWRSDEIP